VAGTNAPGQRLSSSPLWLRVDQNRTKLAVFVALFVCGSALLLDLALVAVPGSLLSLVFAEDPDVWFANLAVVFASVFGVLLAFGAFVSAVQLSNAEHWVRSRFAGRDLAEGEAPELVSAVEDIALAAGFASPPRLMVLDTPGDSMNALAIGTTRKQPLIGVTSGFLAGLSIEEQRAVVATLTARIVAGDIMFGSALAALMGPLKAIRDSRALGGVLFGQGDDAGGDSGPDYSGCRDPGCTDGCGEGCIDGLGDSEGCGGAIGMVVFIAVVIAITYAAVVTAAWIVTLWGRALHRTAYEKADAEGMLLLKDPSPMLSAMAKVARSSNVVGDSDASYDGIFYAATNGSPRVEKLEARRYDRLREVLGTEGIAAPGLGPEPPTGPVA